MRIVRNKQEATELYKQGMFGNKMPMWSLDEYFLDGYNGPIVIRYKIPSSPFYTECDNGFEAEKHIIKSLVNGAIDSYFTFQPSTDDSKLILNAELSLGHQYYPGWQLRYSLLQQKMRPALSEGSMYAEGLMAREIVRERMTPESFSDLEQLIEIYPDSVFEFSVWSDCIGDVAGRNAIVWEVRNY